MPSVLYLYGETVWAHLPPVPDGPSTRRPLSAFSLPKRPPNVNGQPFMRTAMKTLRWVASVVPASASWSSAARLLKVTTSSPLIFFSFSRL